MNGMVAHFAAGAHGALAAASSGLGGTVAVAVGALVVVVAIVLVFVMVMRSNGGSRRAANGLGYDAHRGPLGQPQNGASPTGGRRQKGPAAGWSPEDEFAPGAAMPGAPSGAAGWSPGGDLQASAGMMGSSPRGQDQWGSAPQAQGGWRDSAPQGAGQWGGAADQGGDQWPPQNAGGWNVPQVNGRAPEPAAPLGGGWDAPAAGGRGAPAWGAQQAPNAPAMPWDQPDSGAPSWGAQQAPQRDWNAPAQQPAGPAGWGREPAPANGNWGQAAGQTPQPQQAGADAAPLGDNDRTRVVRPSGGPRVGMIVVRQGKEPGRIFEVRKDRLTIGRSRESDIFLEDLAVSRLHTTVARGENGEYILRDESSANGTYVNGKKISEHILDEGDEIQVGQTVLRFVGR